MRLLTEPLLFARRSSALALTAALLVAGCRSNSELPATGPAVVAIVGGAGQQGVVGTVLQTMITVQVRDANGTAVPGVTVRFNVTGGGGTIFGDSVTTDASGKATLSEWILGTSPGTNTVSATVAHTAVTTNITATAIVGGGVSVRASGSQGYLALVGSTVTPPPAVLVVDSYGNPVASVPVTFRVSSGGGTITGATTTSNSAGVAALGSWALGTTAGIDSVIATIGSGASLVFTAQALTSAPTITAVSPITQSGYLTFQATSIPRVLVQDALGHVLAGVPVTFTVTSGDGTILGGDALSNASGIAAPTDWKMHFDASTSVTATVGLGAAPVVFTTTGTYPSFVIDIRFLTSVSPDVRDAFVSGARRWMRVFTEHLTPVSVNLPAGSCSTRQPQLTETVTDLIIYAEVSPIDGVGQILGSSSPCATRTTSDLPAVGTMQFDSADLDELVTTGQLTATITHEIGHVLGFGTLWSELNLVSGLGSNDPIFVGAQSLATWPAFQSALSYNGRPVPVENSGGSGTAGSHWRESVFHTELMTGYIEAPGVNMPISKVTLASLRDLGYGVDMTQADLFVGNLLAPGATAQPGRLLNELVTGPKWRLPPVGLPTRITP